MSIVKYKPIGITCGQLVEQLKKELSISKIMFAGRLDPLAHGDMIFLLNDEIHKYKSYFNMDKLYSVKILCGISTFTDDILGFIEHSTDKDINLLNFSKH